MITLITGIPGMGKTALLVSMLLEFEEKAERPIFVMGIPDLSIEHVVCPPVSEWTEQRSDKDDPSLMLPYFTFPPNSILVVDECQRLYRPRASASKVPDYVAALETHRHTGLDIILLTQKPKLVDMNVRELVGRHIHIRTGLLGRQLYEWPHIADGESRTDRGDAAKRRFKPPKKAFTKYKSAEAHTKQTFRLNQVWVYLAAALAFFAYSGFNAYATVQRNLHPEENKPVTPATPAKQTQPVQRSGAGTAAAATPAALPDNSGPAHPFEGYKFQIQGFAESKSNGQRYYFQLTAPDGGLITSDSVQLKRAGYAIEALGPCAALIHHHGQFVATAGCGASGGPVVMPAPAVITPPETKPALIDKAVSESVEMHV